MQRIGTQSDRTLAAPSARRQPDLLSAFFEMLFLALFAHLTTRARDGR